MIVTSQAILSMFHSRGVMLDPPLEGDQDNSGELECRPCPQTAVRSHVKARNRNELEGTKAFAWLLEGVLGDAVNFEFPQTALHVLTPTLAAARGLVLLRARRPLASRSQPEGPQKESKSVDGAASGN